MDKIDAETIIKIIDALNGSVNPVGETHAAFTILADEKGNMKYYYIDEFIASNFEVIGNIFDNPDLLEVNWKRKG